jgi:hypothetical protein
MENLCKIEIGVLYRYDRAGHLTSISCFQLRSIRCDVSSYNNKEGERDIEDFPGLILHVRHFSLYESQMTLLVFGLLLKQFRNFTHFTYTN